MKTKTMKVEQIFNSAFRGHSGGKDENKNVYRVKQVTDSLAPVIGIELSPAALDCQCKHPAWKVTIVGAK